MPEMDWIFMRDFSKNAIKVLVVIMLLMAIVLLASGSFDITDHRIQFTVAGIIVFAILAICSETVIRRRSISHD
jgi:fatty acid desaturase